MLDALHTLVPFINSGEKAHQVRKDDALFRRGRWGFRYDKTHINHWRDQAVKYRMLLEQQPQQFREELKSSSPAGQYALLELLSHTEFGIQRNGSTTSQVGTREIGFLFAELIQHHFSLQKEVEEQDDEQVQMRAEFQKQLWRLSVPQESLMLAVNSITPDLLTNPYSPDVLEYMQNVINRMGEKAKNDLGEQRMSQLRSLGVICMTEQSPITQIHKEFGESIYSKNGVETEYAE